MKTTISVNELGAKQWKNEKDKLHRENGPAVIYPNGMSIWYLNGKVHREDGPAVIHPEGTKEWFLNNKRHNENGPARIWYNGQKEWFLNHKEYTEKEWKEEIHKRKLSNLKF